MHQAHNSYKPLQKINLKSKRSKKDFGTKSSYKFKITNQMDDDVQYIDQSEVAATDDHISNEDLQTVAPSVVNASI